MVKRNKQRYFRQLLCILALYWSAFFYAQEGDANHGYKVWEANCTACHKLGKKLIGPDLTGVTEKYDGVWLKAWILNNQKLIDSGDAQAVTASEFDPASSMTIFEGTLKEQDVTDVITWLKNPVEPIVEEPLPAAGNVLTEDSADKVPLKIMMAGLLIISVLLLWLLARVYALVRLMNKSLNPGQVEEEKPIWSMLSRYRPAFNVLIILFGLLAVKGLYGWMLNMDVNKGYTPTQPIYFSHKVHAGDNKIDCQYCHSSAKHSKTSGIPSLNVCMNCHKSINEFTGTLVNQEVDGTAEMQKIYEHVGYDVNSAAYTGETKPIAWKRIHNMQDFVYFNHSQHVVAGEKAIKDAIAKGTAPRVDEINPTRDNTQVCFACHGKVDEMEEVSMASDFTMGWCIECHRTTEIDITANPYYKAADFDKLHEQLKKARATSGKDTRMTVDAIGGLECGKCHY